MNAIISKHTLKTTTVLLNNAQFPGYFKRMKVIYVHARKSNHTTYVNHSLFLFFFFLYLSFTMNLYKTLYYWLFQAN